MFRVADSQQKNVAKDNQMAHKISFIIGLYFVDALKTFLQLQVPTKTCHVSHPKAHTEVLLSHLNLLPR